ncbi:MAG: hypothetical protein ACUVV0_12670 [Anaerolineae bacterium]
MAGHLKPHIHTKFHIDFDWWKKQNRNFRIYLQSHLCPECREIYSVNSEEIDWVDPDTAEVRRVDGLWQALRTCCSHKPDYITDDTPIAAAVFRIFLANNNTPLSPLELSEVMGRKTPELILKTLSGRKIYNGIRPVTEEQ